jgi:nucleoside-diphosphate-sugar epimerase
MKILVTGGSGFIGTNLTEFFYQQGWEFLNIDLVPPKLPFLGNYWLEGDIMEKKWLVETFESYRPTHVVHLAAETDTNPLKTLESYVVNTIGSENVIQAAEEVRTVNLLILTSTQFVYQRSTPPANDEDFAPHTVYGESKVISEQKLRSLASFPWTIIRPTNIWGPWHLRYPFEFWKILAEGKYFHPGRASVIRSYGYVGNVVHQIATLLSSDKSKVSGKVFYVGDEPIDLYEWVNGFSLGQTGKPVRVVSRPLVRALALIGDVLKAVGFNFPITSSRYFSMTTSNPAPMGRTFEELGKPRFTIQEGIAHTVNWMKIHHPHLVPLKKDV